MEGRVSMGVVVVLSKQIEDIHGKCWHKYLSVLIFLSSTVVQLMCIFVQICNSLALFEPWPWMSIAKKLVSNPSEPWDNRATAAQQQTMQRAPVPTAACRTLQHTDCRLWSCHHTESLSPSCLHHYKLFKYNSVCSLQTLACSTWDENSVLSTSFWHFRPRA